MAGSWFFTLKVALVYDRVNKIGGAERILVALHEIWSDAPLFTAVYDRQKAPWAADFKVRPSFLQFFPGAKRHHEFYPWLTPLAFESFNFDDFDIVISVTSADAKGILTKPETLHLCYCLTPTRYLWSGYSYYLPSRVRRFLVSPLVAYLRTWDKIASSRPDIYLATSETVQKRIKKYYHRESVVIYPPVDLDKFEILNPKSKRNTKCPLRGIPSEFQIPDTRYFLVVSRLVPYKRIDIAIRAFNKLGLPLKIVGTGTERGNLMGIAQKNIDFLGNLTDRELAGYYQSCQGLIFPAEEDFGLVPLEAQACGQPAIAFRGGGALETVIEGKTGEFFYPQTPEALASVVKNFDRRRYNKSDCRRNAEKFGKQTFQMRFKKFVEGEWLKKKKKQSLEAVVFCGGKDSYP